MLAVKYSPPENHYITLDIVFATEYGVNPALLFAKLHRLQSEWKGHIDENGDKWVRLTLEEWEAELPFIKRMTIRRTIEECESNGLILSTVFERRSKWYRCNPDYVLHNVSVQNEQIDNEYMFKLNTLSVQNEQLPNSLPNSKKPPYKSNPQPKYKKRKQPKPKDINDYGPVSKAVLNATRIKPTALINGTELDFDNVLEFLNIEQATADQVTAFAKWYGQTPSLKAITDNWGLFEAGEQPRHKQFKQNGNGTGHHRADQKTEPKKSERMKQYESILQ
jgi:hypothetical protein